VVKIVSIPSIDFSIGNTCDATQLSLSFHTSAVQQFTLKVNLDCTSILNQQEGLCTEKRSF